MVKVALAHDYLTQRGGAERVVLDIAAAFPGAPIYTALYEPGATYPDFAELDVRTSPLNRIRPFRRHHKLAFPFLAPTFSRFRVDADVVICSSTGWAHGISTSGKKIVYCHNPARWLYQTDEIVPGVAKPLEPVLAAGLGWLRRWDQRAAQSADLYLANSRNVADRISSTYGFPSQVCHPAVGLGADSRSATRPGGVADDYLLCVCRLLGYKNIGAVIDGVRAVEGLQLVVVGAGPDRNELTQQAAGSDVVFLENLDDPAMVWLYSHCHAAISASHEDFGLMPIEAAMFGRPSIVLRRGGFVETVVEGVTGEFFDSPDATAVADAIRRAQAREWDVDGIAAHGAEFSRSRFASRLHHAVDQVLRDA